MRCWPRALSQSLLGAFCTSPDSLAFCDEETEGDRKGRGSKAKGGKWGGENKGKGEPPTNWPLWIPLLRDEVSFHWKAVGVCFVSAFSFSMWISRLRQRPTSTSEQCSTWVFPFQKIVAVLKSLNHWSHWICHVHRVLKQYVDSLVHCSCESVNQNFTDVLSGTC